jgi:hypothetical protein
VLFIATILLVCVSVVMVYSASAVLALERYQEPYRFLMRQALWAAMGIAVLAVVMLRHVPPSSESPDRDGQPAEEQWSEAGLTAPAEGPGTKSIS